MPTEPERYLDRPVLVLTLYIVQDTVRVHVHAILQKLEVRDRTQAAILALQKGLIPSEAISPDTNQ